MDAWAGVGSHTHMPPLTLHWPLRPLAAGCRLPSSAGQERGELCRGNQGLAGVNRVISRLKGPKKRTHGSQGISHLIPTGMSLQHAASGPPLPWCLTPPGETWLEVDRYVQGKAVRGSGGLATGSAPLGAGELWRGGSSTGTGSRPPTRSPCCPHLPASSAGCSPAGPHSPKEQPTHCPSGRGEAAPRMEDRAAEGRAASSVGGSGIFALLPP